MRPHPSTLYSETVLAHNRAPRHFGTMADPTHRGVAENALCGDRLEFTLRLRGNTIEAAMFEGECCAIATACASILTTVLHDAETSRVAELRAAMIAMFEGDSIAPGEFAAFADLRHHSARQRCALLPFDAALAALAIRKSP